jgi:hypothetical protein
MSGFNPLFTKQTLQFESKIVDPVLVPISNITDAKFGILNLTAVSEPLSDRTQEFIFTVDCSGSMSDQCSDGRTKMQHIVHTIKNMILYFKENSINAFVTINTFDHKIYTVLKRCFITDENFSEIIKKVGQIMPRGSTNIEKALENSRETLLKIKTDFPDHNISHIFMTDGEATAGNGDPDYLLQIVDRSVTNAFIGFGIQHDSTLLNTLGSGENSAYYFVDKLENCGLVYGEILHTILYKLLSDVIVTIENGLIYDFKNNNWVSSLCVGQIASESNKIYHIASSNPDDCRVTFTGKKTDDLTEVLFTVTTEQQEGNTEQQEGNTEQQEGDPEQQEGNTEQQEDLTTHIYRQRTLQHLSNANGYLKRKNIINNNNNNDNYFSFERQNIPESFKEQEKGLKDDLISFITEMKQYMRDKGLTSDNFMKNLCDDVYICYKTLGTKFGAMYVTARQTSQGSQRCYTVSHTPDDTPNLINDNSQWPNYNSPRHCLQRHSNVEDNGCFNCNNLPSLGDSAMLDSAMLDSAMLDSAMLDSAMLDHELSDFNDAPYLTPTSAGLMREISCNNDEFQEEP